jgi:Na+-transporting NADH:ubiquinone oxidoreductase subunit C
MASDSIKKTIGVALAVCLVSSILVTGVFVILKPIQIENRKIDKLKNILNAGGIKFSEDDNIEELFKKRIEPQIIDLKKGKVKKNFSDEETILKPENFDIKRVARDVKFSSLIDAKNDLASIKRVPNYAIIYLVKDKNNNILRRIFPIYGKGLWSTMYGLIAFNKDMSKIEMFNFYEHGETPGLGGEVDNPDWKAKWQGKNAFDFSNFKAPLKLQVIKAKVNDKTPNKNYKIDGLSGSTLTTKGVDRLVRFWLGENKEPDKWGTVGYGRYIKNILNINKGASNG